MTSRTPSSAQIRHAMARQTLRLTSISLFQSLARPTWHSTFSHCRKMSGSLTLSKVMHATTSRYGTSPTLHTRRRRRYSTAAGATQRRVNGSSVSSMIMPYMTVRSGSMTRSRTRRLCYPPAMRRQPSLSARRKTASAYSRLAVRS